MALNEFDIIDRYFSDIGFIADRSWRHVTLGVGDDCAILRLPPDSELAISTDSFVEGVHFPKDSPAFAIAQRSLTAAVSDLAAMGASPLGFNLALTVPEVDEDWLQEFSHGLRACAEHYKLPLLGGDTTRGPLCISFHVHGAVPKNGGLRRNGARVGDSIYVSGSLGDAAAGLAILQYELTASSSQTNFLLSRFFKPEARLALGECLLGIANSAVDISDGLIADLSHIVNKSGVGAELELANLPLSAALQSLPDQAQALQWALSGGDDYELCFTASDEHTGLLQEYADLLGVAITEIGQIVKGQGVKCIHPEGAAFKPESSGFEHFA